MLESVFHIIPNRAGKQKCIIGTYPVLHQTGITQLDILPKPFRTGGRFPFEGGDPGHVE